MEGNCAYVDACWFSHEKLESESNKIKNFKLGICGEKFGNKKDFMQHRKKEHIEKAQDCINHKSQGCRFSGNECWYKHNENESDNNSFEIRRLFHVMEKFATKIEFLECKL